MELDASRTSGTIPAVWFGHNLEHTRSCVWRGLSAQLLRNRKFAGGPTRLGTAAHWHPTGARCWHMLQRPVDRLGDAGEPYVRHFDDDLNGQGTCARRQRIEVFGDGEPCGIAQRGIHLVAGREYELRAVLLSEKPRDVRLGVTGGGSDLLDEVVPVGTGEWTEASRTFTAPSTEEDAWLEVTSAGSGAFYVGAVALVPADTFHGMRRDVVELLKRISAPILRWPGGNFVGCYRWKDGLLPADRRAPYYGGPGILGHTEGYDDHEVGTDEFVALCREIGAEPWITINIGIAAPAPEAAAWVEYCNGSADSEWGRKRAERGHPEPYGVRYWSLGNEMGYGHMSGPNAPAEYARAAAECSLAMREVDPGIVLVASGAWWEEQWFTDVLATAGDSFEHISYHEYTPLMNDFTGDGAAGELRRLATWPAKTTVGLLEEARERIERYGPKDRPTGLSFDEWNVWHAWYREPGVAEGLHAAAMLNMLVREGHRLGVTIGAYFEPVNEGAIRIEHDSSWLTPAGSVHELFRAHHGNEALAIDAPGDDDDVDAAASLDREKGELVVTLMNRSPDGEAAIEFAVKGARVSKAEGVLLSAPDFFPGSTFDRQDLPVAADGSTVAAKLQKHSVALIRVACG